MIIYCEYNIETIFIELMNNFLHHLCDFLGHSSNPLHSGQKDERRRRVSEKKWYCNNKRWRDWLVGKI